MMFINEKPLDAYGTEPVIAGCAANVPGAVLKKLSHVKLCRDNESKNGVKLVA